MNALPIDEQINGARARLLRNANLFGYDPTGRPLSTDEAAELSGLSRPNPSSNEIAAVASTRGKFLSVLLPATAILAKIEAESAKCVPRFDG